MKPVWFLDVDGVLNADRDAPRDWKNDWHHADVDVMTHRGMMETLKVYYSKTVVDFVNEMSDRVDVVWMTSWMSDANTVLAPALGLKGPFPDGLALAGVTLPTMTASDVSFLPAKKLAVDKLTLRKDSMFYGRPVMWTDDELHVSYRTSYKKLVDVPTRLERPFDTLGLGKDHLDRLRTFVDAHAPVLS